MSTLPQSLVDFRSDLEQAIGRELARGGIRRKRRRIVFAVAIAAGAAAIALGLLSTLSGHGPSVVERAAAALNVRANTILHWRTVTRVVPRHERSQIYSHEVWQEQKPPFASREIDYFNVPDNPHLVGGHVRDGRRIARSERTLSGLLGEGQVTVSLFDPSTNTIYVSTAPDIHAAGTKANKRCPVENGTVITHPGNCAYPLFAPGPSPGTVRVIELERLTDHKPWRWEVRSRAVSASEARRIRARLVPPALPDSFRDEVLWVLKNRPVAVGGHVRFGGRDAIRLTWNAGNSVYLVDAHTYEPIQLWKRTRRGTTTIRYLVYRQLPLDAQTQALLSLRAQHPTAHINRDPKAFYRAAVRLSIGG